MKTVNVLFVCLGNICRSPMAEYLMREKIRQAGLSEYILADSAGTSGENDGMGMHRGTVEILERLKIESQHFSSRRVCATDWQQFDYIVAMDQHNLRDLEQLFGHHPNKIFAIASLCPNLAYDHIPDPWYTGKFEQTYALLNECCDVLLAKIRKIHHL